MLFFLKKNEAERIVLLKETINGYRVQLSEAKRKIAYFSQRDRSNAIECHAHGSVHFME